MKKRLAGIILLCLIIVGSSGHCAEIAGGNTTGVDYSKLGFDIMKQEAVGFLRIGLAASEVLAGLGEPSATSPIRIWGADGMEHQKWQYPAKGIEFDMIKHEGSFVVNVIRLTTPCDYQTKQGIRIGSSAKEVQSAYTNKLNPAFSNTKLVVGTIYGGIIFGMDDDAVSSIFIGAAAE